MANKRKLYIQDIEDDIREIAIDLSIIKSLLRFLDSGLYLEPEITKTDIANIIYQIQVSMNKTINKYSELEKFLEL